MGHDQLDILVLKTRCIDFLSVILVFVLLVITGLDGLALAVVVGMVVARVVVSGVVVGLCSSKLLSGRSLGLRVQVLDLGLTKNTAGLLVMC